MGLDYYGILEVPRDATIDTITLAYRRLAILSHPDRKPYPKHAENPPKGKHNEDPLSPLPNKAIWSFINEAFDVLSNSLWREVYDRYGEEGLKLGVPAPDGYVQPYVYHGNFLQTYRDVFGTFSPYADLVDAVTQPPNMYSIHNVRGCKMKDNSIEKLLYLDLREIYFGCLKKMKILRHEFIDENRMVTKINEKILLIKIIPGVLTGTKLCFPEEGDQGPTRIPADIIFIVTEKPHPVFFRKNSDLYMDYQIDLRQALCGFNMIINTLDERRLLISITDVVNPNYIKRVDCEGLPVPGNKSDKGALFIYFDIKFPAYLTRPIKLQLSSVLNETKRFGIDCSHPETHYKIILNDKIDRIAYNQ